MYECYVCNAIYEEQPEDCICTVCYEETVVKIKDRRYM